MNHLADLTAPHRRRLPLAHLFRDRRRRRRAHRDLAHRNPRYVVTRWIVTNPLSRGRGAGVRAGGSSACTGRSPGAESRGCQLRPPGRQRGLCISAWDKSRTEDAVTLPRMPRSRRPSRKREENRGGEEGPSQTGHSADAHNAGERSATVVSRCSKSAAAPLASLTRKLTASRATGTSAASVRRTRKRRRFAQRTCRRGRVESPGAFRLFFLGLISISQFMRASSSVRLASSIESFSSMNPLKALRSLTRSVAMLGMPPLLCFQDTTNLRFCHA